MAPSRMPLNKAEVYVIMYHRAHMELPVPAVEEIFRLKFKPFSPLPANFVSDSVKQICLDAEIKGHPSLRDSKRHCKHWHKSALKDFLEETASGLKPGEQLYLTQIDDDEKEKIDRAVNAEKPKQKSKRGKALKHHDSHNEPKHKRNTHYTDSPNGPRHEQGSPRSHHYQTGGSSTATNFQSPYASSSNNYGRVIENQPAYNSAPYGGGLANAGAPSQSLGYLHAAPAPTPYSNSQAGVPSQSFGNPYTAPAPTPHSGYHAGSSDREGERRSTRPRETSGSTSTNQRPPGPRGPGGRDDVYS